MALHDASHRLASGGSVPAQYAFMIYISHIITFFVSFYEDKQAQGARHMCDENASTASAVQTNWLTKGEYNIKTDLN
jgi:hypothetical protein